MKKNIDHWTSVTFQWSLKKILKGIFRTSNEKKPNTTKQREVILRDSGTMMEVKM
jgi:hypothetical protein